MKNIFLIIIFFSVSAPAFSSDGVFKKWCTIDDETGQKKAVVEVYKEGKKVYGKIVHLFLKPLDSKCEVCEGDDKNKPLIGMNILRNFEANGDEYVNGKIIKADDGNIYKGKFWIEAGKLMVRGYVAFFFRTQEWEDCSEEIY